MTRIPMAAQQWRRYNGGAAEGVPIQTVVALRVAAAL
jgi:hypothetical protein